MQHGDITTYTAVLCSLLARRWEARGFTQQRFLQESGVATGTWSRMMRGQSHFQIEDLRAACEVLEWSVGELTSEADRACLRLIEEGDITIGSKKRPTQDTSGVGQFVAGAALVFLISRLMR